MKIRYGKDPIVRSNRLRDVQGSFWQESCYFVKVRGCATTIDTSFVSIVSFRTTSGAP